MGILQVLHEDLVYFACIFCFPNFRMTRHCLSPLLFFLSRTLESDAGVEFWEDPRPVESGRMNLGFLIADATFFYACFLFLSLTLTSRGSRAVYIYRLLSIAFRWLPLGNYVMGLTLYWAWNFFFGTQLTWVIALLQNRLPGFYSYKLQFAPWKKANKYGY